MLQAASFACYPERVRVKGEERVSPELAVGGKMDPNERATGTRDEHYGLMSVLYHARTEPRPPKCTPWMPRLPETSGSPPFSERRRGCTWGWPNKRRGCSAFSRVRRRREDILWGPNRLAEGYLWGRYHHGRPSRGGRPRHPDRGERPLPRPRPVVKTSRRRERQARPTPRHKARTGRHRKGSQGGQSRLMLRGRKSPRPGPGDAPPSPSEQPPR